MSILDQLQEEEILQEDLEGIQAINDISRDLGPYYESIFDGKTDFIGIRSGLPKLDRLTFGLDGLVVLAATPGKGKSSLALQIALDSCQQFGTPCLFYSMEMPKRALFTKILSRLAKVRFTDILLYGRPILDPNYQLPEGKEEASKVKALREREEDLIQAKKQLSEMASKLFIKDSNDPDLTPERMREEIGLIQAKTGVQKPLVVIDQLQSFPDPEGASPDPKKRIDDLIKSFRKIADETGAVLLVISQKNRSGYKAKELSSLMGSAMIEYTADTVFLLEDPTGEDGKPLEEDPDGKFRQIDLVVPKQRYGKLGKVQLNFEPEFSIFKEWN